jgi:hypothetical protein
VKLPLPGKSFLAAVRRLLNQFRPIIGAPGEIRTPDP